MTAPFAYHVDRHYPVALVRLCGTLDPRTTAQARMVLSRCLAEQPTALVVDLADLAVSDDAVLELLPRIAQWAADWPGAAVLGCAAPPDLAAALGRLAPASSLPLYASQSEALAEAALRPVPPRIRQLYQPARDAAQHARTLVSGACAGWRVPAAAATAELVASELVANAVVHARTVLELSVMHRPPYLYLAVRDGDDRRIRFARQVSDTAEHGRGLLVIDALAASWGTIGTGDGKVVWATLRVGPA